MLVLVKREVHADDGKFKQLYPCYCASLRNMNSLTELLICSSGLELVARKCLNVGLGHIKLQLGMSKMKDGCICVIRSVWFCTQR